THSFEDDEVLVVELLVDSLAAERVEYVAPNRKRRHGQVAIGKPFWVDENHAGCVVECPDTSRTIFGATTLQALFLAIRFAGMQFHAFVAKGGRILGPDGGRRFPLEAYFGPLLVTPAASARSRSSSQRRRRQVGRTSR